MYCQECGGEIILIREVPTHSFQINSNSLTCIDNFDLMGGNPELIFCCINDREHDIEPRPESGVPIYEFYRWMDEVEQFFENHVLDSL